MPRLLAIIFFLVASRSAAAQDWLWARGNTGGGVEGWAVAASPLGDIFVAGTLFGSSPYFAPYSVPRSAGSFGLQSVIAKYDPNGNVLWARGTENADNELINIASDVNGNVYMLGAFGYYGVTGNSISLKVGAITLAKPTGIDVQYFLAKFDPDGNVIWALNAGNSQINPLTGFSLGGIATIIDPGGITTDGMGNVYIVVNYHVPSVTIGASTFTNANSSGNSDDILIVKYDPLGNVVWANSVGGTGSDDANSIAVTPAGDVYIAGVFGSPSINFGSTVITNLSSNQVAFIARFDALGNPVWASGSGGSGGEYAVGITSDASNNVYLTGGLKDNSISFNSTTITNPTPGNSVLYLAKFGPANTISWYKTIGHLTQDTASAWAYSIAISRCGIVWVSGGMSLYGGSYPDSVVVDGHVLKAPENSSDPAFIAGYNTSGIYAGSAALGSGGDDPNAIACDAMGNIYICSDYICDLIFIAGRDTLPIDTCCSELLYLAKYPYIDLGTQNIQQSSVAVCFADSMKLNAQGGYSNYIWSDGTAGATDIIRDTGIYWVYGYDSCVSYFLDTFHVSSECKCANLLFVPNLFTPNGDGQDDVFFPRNGYGISLIKSFRIYNRWGEKVFERDNIQPNDVANAWDGTYKGEKSLPEVFVWVIDAVCEAGNTITKKGSVTIVR